MSKGVPRIGDWCAPKDGSNVGMVVDILPSGDQVVLARPMLDRVVETVHWTADLKGTMQGKRLL